MNLLHNVWLIILFNYYPKERNKETISLQICSSANLCIIEFGHVLFFRWISQFVTRFFSEAVHLMDATRNKFNCNGDERRQ